MAVTVTEQGTVYLENHWNTIYRKLIGNSICGLTVWQLNWNAFSVSQNNEKPFICAHCVLECNRGTCECVYLFILRRCLVVLYKCVLLIIEWPLVTLTLALCLQPPLDWCPVGTAVCGNVHKDGDLGDCECWHSPSYRFCFRKYHKQFWWVKSKVIRWKHKTPVAILC